MYDNNQTANEQDLRGVDDSALKEVLRDMTAVYTEDRQPANLRFGVQSRADINGEWIEVNPQLHEEFDPDVTGPNILRFLDNVVSHEVGHLNWSDLESKKKFSECYPGWGEIPGHVANVLEDQYDDSRRMREWYGMRAKQAYYVWLVMQTDDCAPNVAKVEEESGRSNAIMAAFFELAIADYVKGLADAPDEIAEFCVEMEPIIKRVRTQDDPDQRFKLFHAAMQIIARYVEDPSDFDAPEFGQSVGVVVGEEAEEAPDANTPTIEVDQETAEAIEELLGDAEADDGDESGDEGASVAPESDGEEDSGSEGESGEGESAGSEESPGADTSADPSSNDNSNTTEEFQPGAESGGDPSSGQTEKSSAAKEIAGRDESAIGERFNVDLDDVDATDSRDEARWSRLQQRLEEYGTDVEQRQRDRDERAGVGMGTPSNELRARAERSGVIRDVEDRLRKLVSRTSTEPVRMGERIDMQNVVRRAAGDVTTTELFEHDPVTETGDRCIGLCTDISKSMSQDMDDLKIAGAAIAAATDIIGDAFVWEAYSTYGMYGPHEISLEIVTGPEEDFKWDHLDSFTYRNKTSTASGVRDTKALMEECTANEYMMLVITDGMANVLENGDQNWDEGTAAARRAVDEARSAGIEVVGIGIGDMDDERMEATFGGNNYRLASIETLADDILELYKSTMKVNR